MICEYDELKQYVKEDFQRFYEWGFNEKQIFPAVLDEYKYQESFCENICIHIFLILNYVENGLDFNEIFVKLRQLMDEVTENELKGELRNEYTKFVKDLSTILDCK